MSKNKYKNVITVIDGISFQSRLESRRYSELLLLQRAKKISELELQPMFPLLVNNVKVCTYIADFRYLDKATGEYVVEDCKGHATPVYKLKSKLLNAVLGLKIVEITK